MSVTLMIFCKLSEEITLLTAKVVLYSKMFYAKATNYIRAQLNAHSIKLTGSQLKLIITTTDDVTSSLIAALTTD